MPIEVSKLRYAPCRVSVCPRCFKDFEPFMRGQVQSGLRKFFKMKYCALICHHCKNVVGRERGEG